jgi:hypothetical protein
MGNLDNALRTLKGTPSRAQAGKPAAGILVVLTLACLGLSACGGSSGSSTNAVATGATTTSASGATTTTGASSSKGNGTSAVRQGPSAIRECLQKNGVTLPKRGSGGPAGGAFLGAGSANGPQLPKGMTRAQFEATLKKCGGSNFGARFGRPGGASPRVRSPVFQQALAKFAVCLRQNGVNVPPPNTSGKGPIFNTKGIKTTSPRFRHASMKCRGVLVGAFRGQRRSNGGAAGTGTAGGAAGTATAPPAAGQAPGSTSSG